MQQCIQVKVLLNTTQHARQASFFWVRVFFQLFFCFCYFPFILDLSILPTSCFLFFFLQVLTLRAKNKKKQKKEMRKNGLFQIASKIETQFDVKFHLQCESTSPHTLLGPSCTT